MASEELLLNTCIENKGSSRSLRALDGHLGRETKEAPSPQGQTRMIGQLRLGEEARGPFQIKSCGSIQPDPGAGAPEPATPQGGPTHGEGAGLSYSPHPSVLGRGCPALGRDTFPAISSSPE